jgi:hypothetical protein
VIAVVDPDPVRRFLALHSQGWRWDQLEVVMHGQRIDPMTGETHATTQRARISWMTKGVWVTFVATVAATYLSGLATILTDAPKAWQFIDTPGHVRRGRRVSSWRCFTNLWSSTQGIACSARRVFTSIPPSATPHEIQHALDRAVVRILQEQQHAVQEEAQVQAR